jgi:hypothetical protein
MRLRAGWKWVLRCKSVVGNEAAVAERISWVREAAGERFSDIELNINVMAVGDTVPRWIAAQLHLSAEDFGERGSSAAVTGSIDEMCQQLVTRRERLGFSYVLVSDELMEPFAPVVGRLGGQ